jgi:hypothetical protein
MTNEAGMTKEVPTTNLRPALHSFSRSRGGRRVTKKARMNKVQGGGVGGFSSFGLRHFLT